MTLKRLFVAVGGGVAAAKRLFVAAGGGGPELATGVGGVAASSNRIVGVSGVVVLLSGHGRHALLNWSTLHRYTRTF